MNNQDATPGTSRAKVCVERLAGGFDRSLRDLIAHCRSAEAGGYRPSDVPTARLSPKDLDKLVAEVKTSDPRPRQ